MKAYQVSAVGGILVDAHAAPLTQNHFVILTSPEGEVNLRQLRSYTSPSGEVKTAEPFWVRGAAPESLL